MELIERGRGLLRSPAPRARRQPVLDWMPVPLLLVLGLVIAYPAVRSILLGLYRYRLTGGEPSWVGLRNYQLLAQDPVFWIAIRNTLVFTGVSVLLSCGLGLMLALLTERMTERMPVVQTLLLSPWAVPVIVIAFLFRYMFEQQGGVVNAVLLGLHLVARPLPWLASGALAMPALIAANIWSQMPFFLLVFLASLRGVPDSIVEAARVDGASEVAIALRIKVPEVLTALVPALLIAVITNFNNFALVWSMTEGGPAYDTTTLVVYVYRLAFTEFNIGYASALGTIWLGVLAVFAVVFVRTAQRRQGRL